MRYWPLGRAATFGVVLGILTGVYLALTGDVPPTPEGMDPAGVKMDYYLVSILVPVIPSILLAVLVAWLRNTIVGAKKPDPRRRVSSGPPPPGQEHRKGRPKKIRGMRR